jgi:hypothetical protein
MFIALNGVKDCCIVPDVPVVSIACTGRNVRVGTMLRELFLLETCLESGNTSRKSGGGFLSSENVAYP